AVERTAQAWGVARLWRTTNRVTDAVFLRGRMPHLVQPWARHLLERRERTVFENHLRDLVAAYWVLPFPAALATMGRALAEDLLPAPDEAWSDRLSRMLTASKNARTPTSQHSVQRLRETSRGPTQRRNCRNAGSDD